MILVTITRPSTRISTARFMSLLSNTPIKILIEPMSKPPAISKYLLGNNGTTNTATNYASGSMIAIKFKVNLSV